ncbi:MAG TPA: hypothetical protein VJ810_42865 [Blastocatellia bacterium]|nr:hypothetical protein [Blastocatellia bacterium]
MSDKLLSLYHSLPPWLRSWAASLRGAHLRHWRYGADAERLVNEALEREHWSVERLKRQQEERLAFILHRAATKVPFYRKEWATRRGRGDKASWEYLENWSLLEKETVRRNPQAFLAEDCDRRRMIHDRTSGTTGKPLDLWMSRETSCAWYALFEARGRRWRGVSRFERWANLGGQAVVPARVTQPPFWVWNFPMNQLYLSANHISERNAAAYVEAMERYRVTHLVTYSSSAALLAREITKQGLQVKGMRAVITNAEPLSHSQRQEMRLGFGCEARETYGLCEISAAASECDEGGLHLWPEAGWVETLSDNENSPAPAGAAGRLVCTGLLNADMPLIRYVNGDRLRPAGQDSSCKCGRRLPLIAGIEGRTNDMLITRDGRNVYWLNPVFYGLAVSEAQIVQKSLDLIQVRYVPAEGFNQTTVRIIVDRLQGRMGDVEVRMEQAQQIPRNRNGKFQAVVCEIR